MARRCTSSWGVARDRGLPEKHRKEGSENENEKREVKG